MTARRLAAVVVLALVSATMSGARAGSAEFTTFLAASEGCAGGGDACGTFPVGPFGAVEYAHEAETNGSISITAEAERGLPVVCVPGRPCVAVAQYHAEAAARVWRDLVTPTGVPEVGIATEYRVDDANAEAAALVGDAVASLSGGATIEPLHRTTCSDGSAIVGGASESFDAATGTGLRAAQATFACQSGAPLPAMTWRVSVAAHVSATTSGGDAAASFSGRLIRATIDF